MKLGKHPQCENGRNLLSQFFFMKNFVKSKYLVAKLISKLFSRNIFWVRVNFLILDTLNEIYTIQSFSRLMDITS